MPYRICQVLSSYFSHIMLLDFHNYRKFIRLLKFYHKTLPTIHLTTKLCAKRSTDANVVVGVQSGRQIEKLTADG